MTEILIFAVIAAVLIARLHSVLGQKNDEDELRRRGNPLMRAQADDGDRKVVPMPGRGPVIDITADPADDLPVSVDAQIKRLRGIDPGFDEEHFCAGVEVAFPMIVEAFAAGDKDTLANLLEDGIYQDFAAAIAEREQQDKTSKTEIVTVHDVSIIEASLAGDMLEVTVRIISEQVNDDLPEGEESVEVTDIWTFTRPANSDNPNWKLLETRENA